MNTVNTCICFICYIKKSFLKDVMIRVTTIVATTQLKNDIYPHSEVIKSSTFKWTIYNVYVAEIK